MMSRINIASWGLLIGAVGQFVLCRALFPRLSSWIIFAPLVLPWLMVYAISFSKQAPFGPLRFRNWLMFAMCGYAVITLVVESLHGLIQPASNGTGSTILARVLTYFAALSFVVLIRACIQLSRYQAAERTNRR